MQVDVFAIDEHKPGVVVGAGFLALDVVIPADPEAPAKLWAGGTCGNVLAALAYLGWAAYPVARIGQDAAGRRVAQDLERWGVSLDFLVREEGEGTPVIAEHIRGETATGSTHTFSCRCPYCGSDLPRHRAVRLCDALPMLPLLPRPDVFFFDRVSPGILRITEHCARAGALIVFEPSGIGDVRLFQEMLALAHIVKFSHERLGATTEPRDCSSPLLVVETLGGQGLRYRARLPWADEGEWRVLPAIPVVPVRDTAGAGDWCTAGLLHGLGAGGVASLGDASEDRVSSALRLGQALAAWNCTFEGARGGMYRQRRKDLPVAVGTILEGRVTSDGVPRRRKNEAAIPFACPSCPEGIPSRTSWI